MQFNYNKQKNKEQNKENLLLPTIHEIYQATKLLRRTEQ